TPVATAPNIDTWYDIALNGENVKYSSLEDPYIKYQARKYGISNTIGIWYTGISWYQGPKSQTPTRKQIIDKALEINCREWWGAFAPSTTPPPRGKYIWPTELYNNYDYYLKKLSQLKTSYYKQKK
ncbi:MAG TPA: hypothetical protein PKJ65_05905, partial [Clostridia bacterium]|nr:hypothetical protein [Clostridia bacterium]